IGGRVQAELRSGDDRVAVTSVTSPVQPILLSTDDAEWRWSIVAHESGTFILTLAMSVLKGDSDEFLVRSHLFNIEVSASETGIEMIANGLGDAWSFVSSVAGFISTLASIGAFTLSAWLWRRLRRRQQPRNRPGLGI